MAALIRRADTGDRERWDAYVDKHRAASPYHFYAWKVAVEQAYGHRTYYLMAAENGRLAGVLPLVHIKPPLGKGVLCGLPFCDVGNCLGDSEAVTGDLLRQAIELGRQLGVGHLEIRGDSPDQFFADGQIPVSVASRKVRMILQLPATADALWLGFKSKLRSQVLKAEKNGLSFSFDNGAVDAFYSVLSQNMRDLGSPVHSRLWLRKVIEEYGTKAKVGLVFNGRQCVGAGLLLHAGKCVSMPWASTLRRYNKLNPNMYLYWRLLKYACEAGLEQFDFGRSSPGGGTYTFKAQWGAQPKELKWYRLPLSAPRRELGNEARGIPAGELAAKCWRRLPLPLANAIGPMVRRFIDL